MSRVVEVLFNRWREEGAERGKGERGGGGCVRVTRAQKSEGKTID